MRVPQETYETNPPHILDITKRLDRKLSDYHVLVMFDNRSDSATFECYNSNEADEADLIELKKAVMSSIETLTNSKVK